MESKQPQTLFGDTPNGEETPTPTGETPKETTTI